MTKPIRPEECALMKAKLIPLQVIEAVNELIAAKYNGSGTITIKINEVIAAATPKLQAAGVVFGRNNFFNDGWLDFEELYRENGWNVYFDKPGYNETYDAYYKFTPKVGHNDHN